MAKQYVVTEEEANALLDSLKLVRLQGNDMLLKVEVTPEMDRIHRSFHMVCCNWLQSIGFDGYRK